VASQAECDAALRGLAELLAGVDADLRRKLAVERTVSCRVTDLALTWWGRLGESGLTDLTVDPDLKAQVRLSVGSDDLLALVAGRLAFSTALATGRLRLQASPFDLLRLSAFL
jgi:predicted lipid carrier protein YhbT